MNAVDHRTVAARAATPRPRLSGCALRHTVDACDCLPPWTYEVDRVGCGVCWGDGNTCRACGGWGELWPGGARISPRTAGSGYTGPSSATNDPWAHHAIDNPIAIDDAPF